MKEPNTKQNAIPSARSMDINESMRTKRNIKALNLDFKKIKKLPPFTFITVYDPLARTRCCGLVNIDSISFVFYEKSFPELPDEKGIQIAPRAMVEMYEVEKIQTEDIFTMSQNAIIGNVYMKLQTKLNDITRDKYAIETDSMLTLLDGMLFLDLISTKEQPIELIEWESRAKQVTDSSIEKAALYALRMRQAKHINESELRAARL